MSAPFLIKAQIVLFLHGSVATRGVLGGSQMVRQTLNALNLCASPCYVPCAGGDRYSEREKENTWRGYFTPGCRLY